MAKILREGTSYNQKDVLDVLVEFSSFKDRVAKKFKDLYRELEGKSNEHDLWVNLYMISTDYAEESMKKELKQQETQAKIQKIS
ncbi:hypothetical protein [Desulfolucanica intricata]|uniref:hypothetical protein n=1 Tax=Desulfolucanica intricata TaxID=1285191 RepID=UPI0008345C6C|nr:hypothetical protein [Desulfolucanica intricata]